MELRFDRLSSRHDFSLRLQAKVASTEAWEPVELLIEGVSAADLEFREAHDYGFVRYELGVEFLDAGVRLNLEHQSEKAGGPNELDCGECSRSVSGRRIGLMGEAGVVEE